MADTLPAPVVTSLHTPPTPWLTSALAAGGGSTAFTCVSGFTAAQWAPHVPSCDVVPNGVSPRRWRLGPGGGNLLWFGRIAPEKAPHLALRAAALAGRHLDVVGPVADPEYFAAEVEPLLGANGSYRGHLGGVALSRAVGNASALLVTPAWDEPFGLVCAEAAMTGTPVVAFDRGGIREVLRPGGTTSMGSVVAAGDVGAMAAELGDVLRLDRREVRRNAVEHLSFDRVVDAYERLYTRVLGRRSGATGDHVEVAAS
jgi:glycosyltransferase involved in cell wall biosynthesis